MKIHQKILEIRKQRNLRLTDLHARINKIFGKKALTYRTLQRIQAGHTDPKEASLYQICMGLGITLKELKGDGEMLPDAYRTKKNKSEGMYIYNNKAFAEILTAKKVEFLALRLELKPGGKTKVQKDPAGKVKYKKWVYVILGTLICVVKNKKYVLKKGDCLTIDSRLAHHFENDSPHKTQCIIIQNPRYI